MFTRRLQNSQDSALVETAEAAGSTNTNRFGKHLYNLDGFVSFNSDALQRLCFAKRFCTANAFKTLNDSVPILKTTAFFDFSIAAMTVHLILSRPRTKVNEYLPDTHTKGFGLWLRSRPCYKHWRLLC